MEPFKVWSYKRPAAHSKSRAFLTGQGPMVTEWAFAMLNSDSVSYAVGKARSGFASEDAAVVAARATLEELEANG